jgi:hypothetical protein
VAAPDGPFLSFSPFFFFFFFFLFFLGRVFNGFQGAKAKSGGDVCTRRNLPRQSRAKWIVILTRWPHKMIYNL